MDYFVSNTKNTISLFPHALEHYYGDVVRAIFVGIAVLIGLLVPFSVDPMYSLYFVMPVAIILIMLAGLTNPRGKFVMALNIAACVAGIALAETLALSAYSLNAYVPVAFLEFIGGALLIALYFSVKTFRSMVTGKIGHQDSTNEF